MRRKRKMIVVMVAVALIVSACGEHAGNQGINGTDSGMRLGTNSGQSRPLPGEGRRSPFPPDSVQPLQNSSGLQAKSLRQTQAVTIPYVTHNGQKYVDVSNLAQSLEFGFVQFDQQRGVQEIGDRDVEILLKAGSREAERGGEAFTLAEEPVLVGGRMLLPSSAAVDLFLEEMVFDVTDTGLVVYPSDTIVVDRDSDGPDTEQVDEALDFADDPNDPFAGEDAEGAFVGSGAGQSLEGLEPLYGNLEAVPALKNIDMNALVRTARRYLGVKYKFGAGPYPKTNRFDCSSYTQYVFDKYGVSLPRTARAQMKRGTTVSRKNLRKGDLLFFYVPGRFKSNKVAGHVGIYIGNGKMIHANTEPKNGVQIRSINRAFWKKTFLTAKRVAY